MQISDDNLIQQFRAGLKQAKRQRKSDDIIDFICANAKLFGLSRRAVDMLVEELSQRSDLTVSALADAMAIPDNVLFKKASVADTADLLLNFDKSKLRTQFMQQLELRREKHPELCLFVVAGQHTVVITNMITEKVPGLVHISIPGEPGTYDINVFRAKDAARRLPNLFNHEEQQ